MTALETLFASMTLADLARFAGTSVAHVVEAAYAGRAAAAPKSTTATKVNAKSASKGTSTPRKVARGAMSLDAVLAAVAAAGGPAKMDDVHRKVGGTVPQVRAALQKLAGAGKIAITGERRGTRYTVR
jgi:hypothetical protein